MFKEAYQNGILQALADAGITKTAAPNPGRMRRLMLLMEKHPESFGALGGSGIGAGSTALAGGGIDDILLGAGVGALAGGVSGMGARALRNTKATTALRSRLEQLELKKDLTTIGQPEPTAAEILADRVQMEVKL